MRPKDEGIKCWEFTKCGRDKADGCPAYPKAGRVCYLVAGTLCGGMVQGIFASKIGQCRECDFYKLLHKEKNAKEQEEQTCRT